MLRPDEREPFTHTVFHRTVIYLDHGLANLDIQNQISPIILLPATLTFCFRDLHPSQAARPRTGAM